MGNKLDLIEKRTERQKKHLRVAMRHLQAYIRCQELIDKDAQTLFGGLNCATDSIMQASLAACGITGPANTEQAKNYIYSVLQDSIGIPSEIRAYIAAK